MKQVFHFCFIILVSLGLPGNFIAVSLLFHYRFIIVAYYEMVMKILGNRNETGISLLFHNIYFIRVTVMDKDLALRQCDQV